MAIEPLETTIAKAKNDFKKHFNQDWNADLQAFLTYLNMIYVRTLLDVADQRFSHLLSKMNETGQSINEIKGLIKR